MRIERAQEGRLRDHVEQSLDCGYMMMTCREPRLGRSQNPTTSAVFKVNPIETIISLCLMRNVKEIDAFRA